MGEEPACHFLGRAGGRTDDDDPSATASTRSGFCKPGHSGALPPNEVPIRLQRSRPRAWAAAIVRASSAMSRLRVFSAEAPKPGISKATTRYSRLSGSCAGLSLSPPAPRR